MQGIIVLPKPVTPARIAGNIELFDFELSADEMDAIAGEKILTQSVDTNQNRRLSQVADYLSSIELAAMRYGEGVESGTYRKLPGRW